MSSMNVGHLNLTSCALIACTCMVGCTSKPSNTVSGSITYAGKPVTSGRLLLMDADGVPHTVTIESNGTYKAENVAAGVALVAVDCSTGPRGSSRKVPTNEEKRELIEKKLANIAREKAARVAALPPPASDSSGLSRDEVRQRQRVQPKKRPTPDPTLTHRNSGPLEPEGVVPAKYANPETSRLRMTILPGVTVFDLEIEEEPTED